MIFVQCCMVLYGCMDTNFQ